MAAKPPTPKAHALGTALRQHREAKHLGIRELAGLTDTDPGTLSRYETGQRSPKPEKVSQILATLGVSGAEYEAIMSLTRDTEGSWLAVNLPEQRRQVDALLEFEENATEITTVGPLLVPGLLQTRDYTAAIMSAGGGVPEHEVRTRVAVRRGRRDILTRAVSPVSLHAFIGEAVLGQLIGTPAVMADQLRDLIRVGNLDNVTIRVMPQMSGWHPGLEGLFHLIETTPMPVVHLELRQSSLFLHQPPDVDAYRRAVDEVSRIAMIPENSAGLIAEYITRWENQQ